MNGKPNSIIDLKPISSGASADIFALEDGLVVKLFRVGASEDMIKREADVSILACAKGIPAVAALQSCDIDGRHGIIYPRLIGATLDVWMRSNPLRASRTLDEMAQLQEMVHKISCSTVRALKEVLATDIAYGPASNAVREAATAYLMALPDEDRLLHGDFHLENVMMTSSGMKIIDWSKAAAGHPAADIVRSEMLMRFGIGPDDWITNLCRDWAARRLQRAYRNHTVSTQAIDAWRPVVALAWLRARGATRNIAFIRYLSRALESANLPSLQ
ncbi:phosphotransferase family protein [Sphingobium yanoikuyae]|uniref:phosphotransferase family protein n=1 Tax=Sphingobium yanoikuyae TaxID=13690 RepID=UPI0035AD8BA8